MIVGFSGMFFARLIQAAVSRSRERLADASAVQFTRNPDGLAGALKKIGGLAAGSRIHSPYAAQASHMFFGQGVASFFATHPPLKERVRWLDPNFNGNFPAVSLLALQKQQSCLLGIAEPQPKPAKPPRTAAGSALPGMSSGVLIAAIGTQSQQGIEAARQRIDSIPDTIKAQSRDPYGAQMLVCGLLLDCSETIRNKQLELVRAKADPAMFQRLETSLEQLRSLAPEMRLPVLHMAISALRFLSKQQYEVFREIVKELVDADEQVDLFEYSLQRVLACQMDPVFSENFKKHPINYYGLRGLENETSVMLSALARCGQATEADAAEAFRLAVAQITPSKTGLLFLDAARCSWAALDAALDRINEGSFFVKKQVLNAALACLMYDKEITVSEAELFRAIAGTLDCPVPPWVTPSRK
jgi:hypothetical protein